MMRTQFSAAGLRVLIVEDEMMVAMLLEDSLAEMGCEVLSAPTRADALGLIDEGAFDCAILDINLGDGRADALADELRARGVPYAFCSGYSREAIPWGHEDRPLIEKPYRQADLARLLQLLMARAPSAPA